MQLDETFDALRGAFWKYVEVHSAVRQPHANSFNWTQAGPILREWAAHDLLPFS